MKITIELTDNEVKALKAYLKEVSSDVDPVITKADIEQEIKGMVSGCMQTGSLGDYYQQYTNQQPIDLNRGVICGNGNNDDY